MELNDFKNALKDLYEKSEWGLSIDWPFVYDEDEQGTIYIDGSGAFYFSDNFYNWIESPLKLENVASLRYKKDYDCDLGIDIDEDAPTESTIHIYFTSGEHIWVTNDHTSYSVEIGVELNRCEENTQSLEFLKANSHRYIRVSIG